MFHNNDKFEIDPMYNILRIRPKLLSWVRSQKVSEVEVLASLELYWKILSLTENAFI